MAKCNNLRSWALKGCGVITHLQTWWNTVSVITGHRRRARRCSSRSAGRRHQLCMTIRQ